MTKKELLELIKDVNDTEEIRFRPAYRNDTLELRSVQIVRGAVLISDQKEFFTHEEALNYADSHKCGGCHDCYQCGYVTFVKGETCLDVYVERNFDKVEKDNNTFYKLRLPENNGFR